MNTQNHKTFWFGFAGVIILALFPLFAHLDEQPIQQWDEAQLAVNALEMQRSHNYIVTTYCGLADLWNTKPPLMIWMQATASGLIGPTEPAVPREDSMLAQLEFPALLPSDTGYEFSAWVQFPETFSYSNSYQVQCFDAAGALLGATDVWGKYSTDNAPGLWFRVSKYFTAPARTSRIQMTVHNSALHSYRYMDDVLLRPAGAQVLSKMPGGRWLLNNHLYFPNH